MIQEIEKLVDRAADRIVDGIERMLNAEGRFVVLEKDSDAHSDGIRYLRTQLHEVRTGSNANPGLAQMNISARELALEVGQLKKNDQQLAESLAKMAESVSELKSDSKLFAWKIGTIIGIIVFVASWLADKIRF